MTATKDQITAMAFNALRVCKDDSAGVFEVLTGTIITLAALRPEGVDVLLECVDVLDAARIELQNRRAAGTSLGPDSDPKPSDPAK